MIQFLLFSILLAQPNLSPPLPKSPMQLMLEKNQDVVTKQGQYTVDGIVYDRIEADGKYYYFKTLSREKPIPLYMCDMPVPHESPRLVEGSLKVFRRKRIFFTALIEKCTTKDPVTGYRTNNKRTYIEVDPITGIHLPENKDDLIKNKKVGIPLKNPQSLFFSGEF